jgi:hypothetical protein
VAGLTVTQSFRAEEDRTAPRQGVMRLQPYQIVFVLTALFWVGLLITLLLAHGQTHAPEHAPFQGPF